MNKAFEKEPEDESDEHDHAAEQAAPPQVAAVKNYITPSGLQRLKDEHRFLLTRERPAVTRVVTWAASNGDRSENADYQYRQTAAARDRSADSLSHEADRCCGNRGPGSPERWAGGDAGLLRSDRALRQRLWNGAGGERRRRRRGRSGSQPHQLVVATGPCVDEVRSRRSRGPSRAGRYGATADPRGALSAHPCGALQRTTRSRGRADGSSSGALVDAQALTLSVARYSSGRIIRELNGYGASCTRETVKPSC